ncbi:hypothetical protein Mapa_001121 [Marchantia paleacea]|nr:hypothetical protein Mapa_001121 [Marchantia paleacea]
MFRRMTKARWSVSFGRLNYKVDGVTIKSHFSSHTTDTTDASKDVHAWRSIWSKRLALNTPWKMKNDAHDSSADLANDTNWSPPLPASRDPKISSLSKNFYIYSSTEQSCGNLKLSVTESVRYRMLSWLNSGQT